MENDTDLYLNRQEEESELFQRAISNLNEEQRTCIDLFYYQLKPYQEVASMTGYDLNKVKAQFKWKKKFKKIYEENNRTNG